MSIELIAADLCMIKAMFEVLEMGAHVEDVQEIKISFKGQGGDQIVVGYGEQGEPAVLAIFAA